MDACAPRLMPGARPSGTGIPRVRTEYESASEAEVNRDARQTRPVKYPQGKHLSHRLSPLIVSMLLLAGCSGDSTPVSPTPSSFAASPVGAWAGSFSDPVAGEGTARLALSEQPVGTGGLIPTPQGALAGTWSVTFRNGETLSGPAIGFIVSGASYGFILYPDPAPPCATGPGPASGVLQYSFINTVVTSSRFTAVLSRGTCAGLSFGTVSLGRQ